MWVTVYGVLPLVLGLHRSVNGWTNSREVCFTLMSRYWQWTNSFYLYRDVAVTFYCFFCIFFNISPKIMTGSKNECREQIQRMILPLYTNFERWTNSLLKFTAKVTANFTYFCHVSSDFKGESERHQGIGLRKNSICPFQGVQRLQKDCTEHLEEEGWINVVLQWERAWW